MEGWMSCTEVVWKIRGSSSSSSSRVNYTAGQISRAQSSPLPNYYNSKYHHRVESSVIVFIINSTFAETHARVQRLSIS